VVGFEKHLNQPTARGMVGVLHSVANSPRQAQQRFALMIGLSGVTYAGNHQHKWNKAKASRSRNCPFGS